MAGLGTATLAPVSWTRSRRCDPNTRPPRGGASRGSGAREPLRAPPREGLLLGRALLLVEDARAQLADPLHDRSARGRLQARERNVEACALEELRRRGI